jgi:3-methyladenine DNA glycosylase AlkD
MASSRNSNRPAKLAAGIEVLLRELGKRERAIVEKRYLKSELEHFGVSVPDIRRVALRALKEVPEQSHDELIQLVRKLWSQPVHELRMTAVELLNKRADSLRASDIKLIERLLRQSKGWALVDNLACNALGSLVERHPPLGEVLDRWSVDEDLWMRRAAMLALLVALRRGVGDFERFGRYAEAMLDEREFFIRKAIGWILRDTSRRRPKLVYEWALPRASRMSGVTIRETVKYLSDKQRRRLLAAHSAKASVTAP